MPSTKPIRKPCWKTSTSLFHKETVLENFYEPFSHLLQKADKEIETVEAPVEVSDVKCEKCGRMMVYKQGRYGKFLACPGFPECRNTKPILKKIGVKCPDCGGDIIERKTLQLSGVQVYLLGQADRTALPQMRTYFI